MTKKIYDFISSLAKRLASVTSQPTQEAWWLMEKLTGNKKQGLLSQSNILLSQQQEEILEEWMTQRIMLHKPLQYILGTVPFCDVEIIVQPPTLIPRPETEEWCAWLISLLKKEQCSSFSLLDICTGSGCIALAVAQAFPQANIVGSDLKKSALELATKNKHHNSISNASFLQSDLFTTITDTFDIILSNPPYISFEEWKDLEISVQQWEDRDALVGQKNGIAFYEALIERSSHFLKKQRPFSSTIPALVMEIGHTQAHDIQTLLQQSVFKKSVIHKDYAGHDRWISCFL